ncbi:MAG: autotransporter domain-containing protein [Porphyrobacter sp.]|nr:autotransporter domain-containing protein [Porphyrobacter sp.]
MTPTPRTTPLTLALLAGTALAAPAHPLAAQTVINTARTTAVATATANGGQPADVKIDTAGSVTVTGGAAVTVNSDNDITNAGKIAIANADNATGILVSGPRTADIANSGTITIDETYTATDSDNDGDLDGPFAIGTGRTAILVDGALTGNLSHTGTISVEGNQSAGIRATGPITGTFTHEGKTTVIGNQSVGVAVEGISGNVRLAGEIAVKGEGAQGAVFAGDVGGALRVQSAITVSGYRTIPAPSDTSKLDADDLLQGGSALVIEGNLAKGLIFETAPADNVAGDNDEDKDGIDDAKEGNAKIIAYGSAPAVQIGAADHDIAIGATQGTASGFGMILAGSVLGDGVYSGVNATGMRIGGRGGAVSVAGGMITSATIAATARNADATALDLAAGTTLPELRNSGTITAKVTGTTGGVATALLVETGAALPVLKNAKTIAATTLESGTAYAIRDLSGTLGLVENSGAITASGAEAGAGRNVAIDLSARSANAVIRQTAVASGVAAPTITGDIRFGSGDDLLDIADGKVTGDVAFGAGADRMALSGDAVFVGTAMFGGEADRLELAGTSVFSGTAAFGGGAGALTIAGSGAFAGRLTGAQNVAVTVGGGSFAVTGPATIASLDVSATGIIGATVGGGGDASTAITVTGNAAFAKGAKIAIRLADITDAEGTFNVLSAGTLTGAADLAADSALVPFMYKATLAVAGNSVTVDIDRKATADLGLNASESAAFDKLYAALAEDADVAAVFLAINSGTLFQAYVAQTLPDHAGGTFEGLSQGLRTFDRQFMDPTAPFDEEGKLRIIADFANWNANKNRDQSAAYDLNGLGFRGGLEYLTGIGAFGITGSWLWSKHKGAFENDVLGDNYEIGAHWRGKFGPVIGFARAGIGKSDYSGSRRFVGGSGEEAVDYTITRNWSGDFVSATGGVSIEGGGQFFFFRPSLVLDYLRLSEDGYEEQGGGDALNLTVEGRKSDELALNAGLALGADLWGMQAHDTAWFRIEGEGGWRQILSGDLGKTVARYGDGEQFTLTPDPRESGWFARLRALGGDGSYTIAGEVGLEEQFGQVGYSLRASLRFGW